MQSSERPLHWAYVALGSNLDDPIAKVMSGLAALSSLPRTRLERSSGLYRTAPVGMVEQPDFINAVCRLRTALEPTVLLERLLAIEAQHGRSRNGSKGGPRTLDLDLLLYEDLVITTPNLVLPHPRLHERAFVLYPLAELDPAVVVPGRGRVSRLLQRCGAQRVHRLESGHQGGQGGYER
jgi:2-amino-4-hydroxy-6-hydroxymethyldihydropteridine diphosphokinase